MIVLLIHVTQIFIVLQSGEAVVLSYIYLVSWQIVSDSFTLKWLGIRRVPNEKKILKGIDNKHQSLLKHWHLAGPTESLTRRASKLFQFYVCKL